MHESVMEIYTSINKYNKGFEDVERWLFEIKRPFSGYATDEMGRNEECENLHNTETNATFGAVHDDIQPNDSISNVGSRKCGSKTGISRTSYVKVKPKRLLFLLNGFSNKNESWTSNA